MNPFPLSKDTKYKALQKNQIDFNTLELNKRHLCIIIANASVKNTYVCHIPAHQDCFYPMATP